MESNGEYKLIIYRLDELTKICQNINTQMTDTIRINAKQDVDINELGIEMQTIQSKLAEHKSDHKYNTGIILTVAGLIGGVISFIVSFIRGK